MRLIDANELIEHAYRDKLDSRELIANMIKNAPTVKEIPTNVPLDLVIKALEQEPKTEWIPVSKRLPELGKRVLCQCQANIYDVLKLTVDGWYYNPNHCYMESFVIAWMPLPEPYKEDDMTREEREAIISDLKKRQDFFYDKDIELLITLLEQEQKTGHWIEVIDEIDSLGNMTRHRECSICGKTGCGEHKYCPNCGCRMENNEN